MRSALLDTNLFLLLIVGLYDKNLIGKHKRTNAFTPEDFDLLVELIDPYRELWITSHCLAEVSNLLKQTHSGQALELLAFLGDFVDRVKESHIQKDMIFNGKQSFRLGVADTGIVIKSKRVSCVFTVDLDLYLEISNKGNKVINFNHLRVTGLLQP